MAKTKEPKQRVPQDADRFYVADEASFDYLQLDGSHWSLDEFDLVGRVEGLVWSEKKNAWTYSKQRAREVIAERKAAKNKPDAKPTKTKREPKVKDEALGLSLTIDFEQEKTTPGTIRYKEVVPKDHAPIVGTLYLKKAALNGKAPKRIQVEIKA